MTPTSLWKEKHSFTPPPKFKKGTSLDYQMSLKTMQPFGGLLIVPKET